MVLFVPASKAKRFLKHPILHPLHAEDRLATFSNSVTYGPFSSQRSVDLLNESDFANLEQVLPVKFHASQHFFDVAS